MTAETKDLTFLVLSDVHYGNVFIERHWRSVKYEEIYLKEHATIPVLHAGLEDWFSRYNDWRPHETHGNLTPAVIYQSGTESPTIDPSEPIKKRG